MTGAGLRRRRALQALGSALAVATAGCFGSTSTDDGTTEPTPTERPTTGAPEPTGDPTATTTSDTPTAGTVARSVVQSLLAGDYEAARSPFSSALAGQLSAQRLEERWKKQRWSIGGPERIRPTTGAGAPGTTTSEATATADGAASVVVHVQGGHGRLAATVDVRDGAVTGLSFALEQTGSYSPPTYARPDRYREEPVTVDAGTGYPLPGTVTLPTDRDGPVPGLVLVHGSGPQDRDETVGPQRPFRDLSVGLASRGVAVLRYRKRTREYSVDDVTALTPDWTVVEDAVAGVRTLSARPAVRTDGVGLLGHSLGGYLGPKIAERSDRAAALVLANAPGRALWRANRYQLRQIYAWDGSVSDEERARLDRIERVGEQVSAEGFPAARRVFGQYGAFWNAVTDYDQGSVAAGLSIPVTVRQGSRDIQVPPESSTAAWRTALDGVADASVERHAGLNHLLLPTDGPSFLGRYYTEPRNVAQPFVDDIADWLPRATSP
ncbi:alpha/beta hydrolase [Haloarchaeobius iranensis]|uniref:AB hydrolase-1 domain-containing protein n=1 Tax=Haloarchaeobius iranensis TaxID=996166 RepID=A0A1H0AVE2_9EURY|nr:alpha/beta hydrolase [Haloarchaeobius iranensis]SDN37335.1 hypothetical protein SAMN05192554_13022 [Haloarchaeobius iranensis]